MSKKMILAAVAAMLLAVPAAPALARPAAVAEATAPVKIDKARIDAALAPDRGRTVAEIDCRPHACTRCEPRRPVAPEMATPSTRVVVAVMVTGRRTR